MANIKHTNPDGKVCARCDEFKPWNEFPKSGKTKEGIQKYGSYCKECKVGINKISRELYKDAMKEARINKYHNDEEHRNKVKQDVYASRAKAKEQKETTSKLEASLKETSITNLLTPEVVEILDSIKNN